tara:strand:- start:428 stop:721 length:294 start_codon:yes stop_codon:yes gene_type:complete
MGVKKSLKLFIRRQADVQCEQQNLRRKKTVNGIKKMMRVIIIILLAIIGTSFIVATIEGGIAIYEAPENEKSAVALELVDKLSPSGQIERFKELLGL